MTNEINAHAAARWGVATDATANATPAGATQPCCLDSSPCARHASDPLAEAELTRQKIERAVETLELKSMVQRKIGMRLNELQELYSRQTRHYNQACLDVECASFELAELRKGTT